MIIVLALWRLTTFVETTWLTQEKTVTVVGWPIDFLMVPVCKTGAAMVHRVVLALMWSAGENVTALVPHNNLHNQILNPILLFLLFDKLFVTQPGRPKHTLPPTFSLLPSPFSLSFASLFIYPSPHSPGQGVCCDSFTCMFVADGAMNCSEENECAFAQTCKYPLITAVSLCIEVGFITPPLHELISRSYRIFGDLYK